jgi:hypothetical protein
MCSPRLGLFWADRVWQVRRLLSVLGDCDEWRPRGRPVRELDRSLPARVASDHLPPRGTVALETD